jgi:phosphoglycolate phosphatase
MIKAIIFDYDGVIVDSFISLFAVYKKICKHFQVSCPDDIEEFRKVFGYSYVECLNNLGVSESNFPEAASIYNKEIVKMEHEIYAGISEVISQLHQKYKIYLVSASTGDEVLSKIKKFDLISFFSEIHCGADREIRKSVIIADLLKRNDYHLNEVISIGDRAIDYDVAKKVGLDDRHVILVNYGWGLNKSLIGAAKVAEKPIDILELVSRVDFQI